MVPATPVVEVAAKREGEPGSRRPAEASLGPVKTVAGRRPAVLSAFTAAGALQAPAGRVPVLGTTGLDPVTP